MTTRLVNEMASKWDKNPDLMKQKILMRRLEAERAERQKETEQKRLSQSSYEQPDLRTAGTAPQPHHGTVQPGGHGSNPYITSRQEKEFHRAEQEGTKGGGYLPPLPAHQPPGELSSPYSTTKALPYTMGPEYKTERIKITRHHSLDQPYPPVTRAAQILGPYSELPPGHLALPRPYGHPTGAEHQFPWQKPGHETRGSMLDPSRRGLPSWREIGHQPSSIGDIAHSGVEKTQYDPAQIHRVPPEEELKGHKPTFKAGYTPEPWVTRRRRNESNTHISRSQIIKGLLFEAIGSDRN